jgi:hypothetical protein
VSQETATVDRDLELESRKKAEGALLRSQRNTAGTQAPVSSAAQTHDLSGERSLGARVKAFFEAFAQKLEGDHESHKYRG